MKDTKLIQTSFVRENLSYRVVHTENKLGAIKQMIANRSETIIIFLTYKKALRNASRTASVGGILLDIFMVVAQTNPNSSMNGKVEDIQLW
ncbi:MAG: hypothetical protein CM15mP32_0900 [Flavobacteriaceae bacterium]|nr:MAG: hypothetical protein CM15mP32_0900 [Flavobacteriaceae bacterium]